MTSTKEKAEVEAAAKAVEVKVEVLKVEAKREEEQLAPVLRRLDQLHLAPPPRGQPAAPALAHQQVPRLVHFLVLDMPRALVDITPVVLLVLTEQVGFLLLALRPYSFWALR